MKTQGYLDKHQSAQYSGNSERALDYARSRGDLPFYRVGRKILFAINDLDRYMQRFRVDVAAMTGEQPDAKG